MADNLDTPIERKHWLRIPKINFESERLGRSAERIARFSGTPQFLVYLTMFVGVWIAWNTLAPAEWQFDKAELGFTALTLMLSLQASYAAPLILLAQNRQDDRDRVQAEQDRQRAERNLTDTEYLTREIAGLRLALQDMATRDFVRSELRGLIMELREDLEEARKEEERRDEERHEELREELRAVEQVCDPSLDPAGVSSTDEAPTPSMIAAGTSAVAGQDEDDDPLSKPADASSR